MIFDLVLSSCHENCQLNVVEDPWLTGVWKHWPSWWKRVRRHSFCLRCKQEIYGGIFKRWNTSQNSKPQAKGCYILPWHNFLFNIHKGKNTRIFPWVWSSECAKTKSCLTLFFPPLTTVFRILGDEEEDDVYSERVCIFLERLSF